MGDDKSQLGKVLTGRRVLLAEELSKCHCEDNVSKFNCQIVEGNCKGTTVIKDFTKHIHRVQHRRLLPSFVCFLLSLFFSLSL